MGRLPASQNIELEQKYGKEELKPTHAPSYLSRELITINVVVQNPHST